MTFQINDIPLINVNIGHWDWLNSTTKLDGTTLTSNQLQLTWSANILTVAEYDAIFALKGTVCRVKTTDYNTLSSLNDYIGTLHSIEGTHRSINYESVSIKFIVTLIPEAQILPLPYVFGLVDGDGNSLIGPDGSPLTYLF